MAGERCFVSPLLTNLCFLRLIMQTTAHLSLTPLYLVAPPEQGASNTAENRRSGIGTDDTSGAMMFTSII